MKDALATATLEELKSDGTSVWIGDFRISIAQNVSLSLVEQNEVIVTVY